MTQAKLDLKNQLEQNNNTDLTNQPLFNDSPFLLLEVMYQAPSLENAEQYFTEKTEHPDYPWVCETFRLLGFQVSRTNIVGIGHSFCSL